MNARVSKPAIDDAIKAARVAERSLKELRREVNRRSNAVCSAGFGLCAIGDLLGADSSEHYMTDTLNHGLANAVVAIGELLQETGSRLWEISEPEEE
ncbi:hypothetical protein D9M70_400670 [compost metagenome]